MTETRAPDLQPAAPLRRRSRSRLLVAGAVLLMMLAVVAALVRLGALMPAGRSFAEWAVNGLDVGGYGRLHVEGLGGDIWRDFTIRRLTIDDGRGAWLDARSIRVRWNWPALLARRLDIDDLDAGRLTLVRTPGRPKPQGPGGPSPLSVRVARIGVRLELLPAFSTRYGLYDVTGAVDVRRSGGAAGHLSASSDTHRGDHAVADFDLGRDKTVRLALQVVEADGGALAGALGLAADRPFLVDATASGTTSEGQFRVTSRSGALTPIAGSGAWTPRGGRAQGMIALAATRYLAGFQQVLGPTLQFQVAGARAPDSLDELTFSAKSDNVSVSGHGEADIGRLATGFRGLALNIVIRDGERVLGWPDMGGVRFAGVLGGRSSDWRLAGPAQIEAPAAFGYRLASLSGPIEIDGQGGELNLKVTAEGVGGTGAGVVPALLGARPHATAAVALLPGGRVLIRQLGVTGDGLKIEAAGQRTLLGGLQFKGQATFGNLGLALAGAHGLMTASWTAAQSGAGPWRVNFDGGAKGLATGIADLDRLLGPAPTMQGAGALDAHGLQIASARLAGAAGALSASGLVGGDGGLSLKLAWGAKGPLDVGPLEITGAMDGTAQIGGTIADPRADLAATFASIDLPQLPLTNGRASLSLAKGPTGVDGAFSLAATSRYGPAKASTAFHLLTDGVALDNLDVEAGGAMARGSLALRAGAASDADLTFDVGPGAFLARGGASGRLVIADNEAGARADVTLSAAGALTRTGDFIIQNGSFRAKGPLSALPYQLRADGFTPHGSWLAAGGGTITASASPFSATFQGQGRLRTADFRTSRPATVRWGDGQLQFTAQGELGGGQARIEATDSQGAVRADASMTNVSLGLLDPDFVGRFDADVSLEGQGSRLAGSLEAKLAGAGVRGAAGEPTLNGEVKAALNADSVTVDASVGNAQGLTSKAHLVLPAHASAAPFDIAVLGDRPMRGQFSADGQVRPLWDLLMGGERSLAGLVHARATLAGTPNDPIAEGEAAISGGQFSDSASGLKLTGVTLIAQLQHDAVDVTQFAGQDGAGGSVTGSGALSLARAGASDFRLSFKHFRLIDNDTASATATGQATLSRAANGSIKLAGALSIDRADIAAIPPTPSGVAAMDVVEVGRQPGEGGHLQRSDANAPAVALDVTLKAPRGVFIKGRGLDVELALNAHVTGTTAAPELTGTATVTRGDYDLAGKRFVFDTHSNVRLSADPKLIRLDLTATREDPTLTAVIHIQGTAAKPNITLSSTPVLPNDEVLSQVLFGASTAQLSPFDAAELASAMTSLSGGSGFDVLGNLRSFAHLDRLALGGGPGMAVSGGKYITDRIYLEVGGGPAGPQGSVEWRVQKNLSVVSRLAGGPGGDSQIAVRWRKDY